MEPTRKVAPDIHILPSHFAVPGLGVLPINSYLITAREPVLVDTGLHQDGGPFMQELEKVIDPAEVRWLWLTHPDQDHIGSLKAMMQRSPSMRVITTFLGMGIYSLFDELPMDRVYFLNPGESIDVGDRKLTALRPPTFDNPSTTALYDEKSRALFSSDCFGALLAETAEDAGDIPEQALFEGQVGWTAVDSPWLHKVDEAKFAAELDTIRQMAPDMVLSSHLPPARSMTERLLASLAAVPASAPFVGPNQAALEAMLAQMTAAPATGAA